VHTAKSVCTCVRATEHTPVASVCFSAIGILSLLGETEMYLYICIQLYFNSVYMCCMLIYKYRCEE
jgi:hypothetical protein